MMSEPGNPNGNGHTGLDDLRDEVAGGLRYAHTRANANTGKLLEVASFTYAAIELLSEKGLLPIEELDERKKTVAGRLMEKFADQGMGVVYQNPEYDKYGFEGEVRIDCENRLHLCKAACCRLRFALSKQDVEEGIVKWEFARPYLIARGPDGYCQHLDRNKLGCTIHANRPVPCRAYDCRKDQRIWLDFDRKIPNPRIYEPDWPQSIEDPPANEAEPTSSREAAGENRTEEERYSPQPVMGEASSGAHKMIKRFLSNPVLYQFGNRALMGYGLFLALGFQLGILYWFYLVGVRFRYPLPQALVILGMVPAVFVGSRLFFIAERELASWLNQSAICARGHTLYGGILGGLIYWMVVLRLNIGSFLFIADCAAPAIALGYAIGKLGCLSYGCCIGRPTRSRLSLTYRASISKAVGYYGLKNIPLIPVQVYETLLGLSLFVILSLLPAVAFGTGQVFGLFILLLSLGRMFLFSFRYRFPDERASTIIFVLVNLVFMAVGVHLLPGPSNQLSLITYPAQVGIRLSILLWMVFISSLAAVLILSFFGITRVETEQ